MGGKMTDNTRHGIQSIQTHALTLFCISSSVGSAAREGYFSAKKSRVSLLVLKEFISINLTPTLNSFRMPRTCLAVRSKKELVPFTESRDFALSNPMEVPSPPLSFSTTVCFNRAGF